jgi:phosphocarrier protein HPr
MSDRPLDPKARQAAPTGGAPVEHILCSALSHQSQEAMNGETLRRLVTITNPQGLHMRPASAFVQRAGLFQSTVTVAKGDQRVNGKSLWDLMLLAAEQGTELALEVSGDDARAAIDTLAELLCAQAAEEPSEPPLPPKG